MSVFAVERQWRFSCRCRAAWRTRFSCCLILGISEKDPQVAGRAMVATLAPYAAPVEDAERERQERRLERDRRRREKGKPAYFESDATFESWPIAQDPAS